MHRNIQFKNMQPERTTRQMQDSMLNHVLYINSKIVLNHCNMMLYSAENIHYTMSLIHITFIRL